MTVPVFSINGAAEVLERDRRTITKALRHTKPDKKERGQDRWRLRTILDALDQLPGSSNARRQNVRSATHWLDEINWLDPVNWRDPRIVAGLAEFKQVFAEMEAIEDMAKRRAFAQKKLGPLMLFHDTHFTEWEIDNDTPGRFPSDSVYDRVSTLWLQEMAGVRSACGWNEHEGQEFLVDPFDYQ